MRNPHSLMAAATFAFAFLLLAEANPLLEENAVAKGKKSTAAKQASAAKLELEQSDKNVLHLMQTPAEDFVKNVLEDFRSQLSDGFPEYGLPSLDPLQVPKMAFNLSSEMFEVNFTSSNNLNLTNLANFTTDLVSLDLNTSELEIEMNVSEMRVDGELLLEGAVLDIFPIYGEGPFWIEIYGVTLTVQSDVNINGQGFIQASNLNVSARYSELDMRFFQCNMCSNGEIFEDMLHLIGTNIWTETEQLLVGLLQQGMHNFLSEAFQKCSADEIVHDGQC